MKVKTKKELYAVFLKCPKGHKTVELVFTENLGLCHTCKRKYSTDKLKVEF